MHRWCIEDMNYEVIDSAELAKRWELPEPQIRDAVRSRRVDPIPHVKLGHYVRFEWGHDELKQWRERHESSFHAKQERGRPSIERRTKMRGRHQSGYIYKKSGWWYVRYYDTEVQEDGSVRRVQPAKKIASVAQYPRKADVKPLVEEFLKPLNAGQSSPIGAMTLAQFVEEHYEPYVTEQMLPSTRKGYLNGIWRKHVRPRVGNIKLRDFTTYDGEQLLQGIARDYAARNEQISRTTLKHIKALLSGMFTYARRVGALNGANPMQGVAIPKNANEARPTYAYSLDEIRRMLAVLPEPARTMVAVAAFTGLRKGEIRGLRWEDYETGVLRVSRSIWNRHINKPKGNSAGEVPVISVLAQMLDSHRMMTGSPASGPMFRNYKNGHVDLDSVAKRVVIPALQSAGLSWHGWHAFRRGLATNLHDLGIADKTIQMILRHSDVSVTQRSYIKSLPKQATAAMQQFELAVANHAPKMHHVN